MKYRAVGTAFVVVEIEAAGPGEALANYRRWRNAMQRLVPHGHLELFLSADSHEVQLFEQGGHPVPLGCLTKRGFAPEDANPNATRPVPAATGPSSS